MDGSTIVEYLAYALQGILIVLAIAIVLHKNNGTIIILIASFSLVTASLYIINKAPDVAIAEIAIGSAIIPLIYVISISRQREFIVLDRSIGSGAMDDIPSGFGYVLLHQLAEHYHLELNITNDPSLCQLDEALDRMLTQSTNVDLIISKHPESGHYVFKGKRSSTLMKTLKQMAADMDDVDVILFKDGEFGG